LGTDVPKIKMSYKCVVKLADAYRSESRRNTLASSRVRGHWLSKYWKECDDNFYPSDYNWKGNDFFSIKTQLDNLEPYDVIIMNKTYEAELVKRLRERGQKVILDLCDPDWQEPYYSDKNRKRKCLETMKEVNVLVINGIEMYQSVKKMFPKKPIYIIPDRIDLDWHKPRKQIHNKELKNICWYGYSANLVTLEPYIKDIIDMGLQLTVISDKFFENLILLGVKNPREFISFKKWDLKTINELIVEQDCVFLGDKLTKWKSNNRMLTAWALRMPVAKNIKDLKKLVNIDERIKNASQGFEMVKEKFDIKESVENYKQLIWKEWRMK